MASERPTRTNSASAASREPSTPNERPPAAALWNASCIDRRLVMRAAVGVPRTAASKACTFNIAMSTTVQVTTKRFAAPPAAGGKVPPEATCRKWTADTVSSGAPAAAFRFPTVGAPAANVDSYFASMAAITKVACTKKGRKYLRSAYEERWALSSRHSHGLSN